MFNERQCANGCRAIGFRAIALMLFCMSAAWAQEERGPTVPPTAGRAAQQLTDAYSESAITIKRQPVEGKMVVVGKSRRLAIVNGKTLKAGDEHNGSKVMAVQADKVVMGDETKSLALTPNVVKQKPARPASVKGPVILPAEDRSSKGKGV